MFHQDQQDPGGTIEAVRTSTSEFPGYYWEPILAQENCCCTVVKILPEAMRDVNFHGRGLFDHTLVNEAGDTLPAPPVAVAPQFRGDASVEKAAPGVGVHNDIVLNQK